MGSIKIAYFIDRIIEGGTELQLVEQINRLEEKGVKQVLFCLYETDEQKKIDINCRTEVLNVRSLAKLDTLKKMKYVVGVLRREKIDIVQTYFFDSTVLGVLCGKIAGVKRIISCRRDMGFWYTKKLLFILRIVDKLSDRILVNSNAVRRNVHQYEKVPVSKIDVMMNGIDVTRYRYDKKLRAVSRKELSLNNGECCIGIIANMREVKRVDLFIKAARKLTEKGMNARYYILGDGDLRAELEHLVNESGLAGRVYFLGKNYDRRRLLSALDIGVITSDSEGLSNAVMEYMASGIPTVASAVGGNLELIRDEENGCLFGVGDEGDLSDKLKSLMKDPVRRERYGQRALTDIMRFDWKYRTDELLSYYQELLEGVAARI